MHQPTSPSNNRTAKPSAFTEPVVIIANGVYPRHPQPLQKIREAGTRICTDGSADRLLRQGISPHVIIGDMDSVKLPNSAFHGVWVPSDDQSTTDLEKALEWCTHQSFSSVTIVGASGLRDDHTLATYLIIPNFIHDLTITMMTDDSTIQCLKSGDHEISVQVGQTISMLAFDPVKSITTRGLEYPLKNESLRPSGHGVSNRASQDNVLIRTSDPVWVFIQHSE